MVCLEEPRYLVHQQDVPVPVVPGSLRADEPVADLESRLGVGGAALLDVAAGVARLVDE